MKKIIIAAFCFCFAMASGNSFAYVVLSPEEVHIHTKTVAWDATTNGAITSATTNVGVALYVTNDTPNTMYISILNPSSSSTGLAVTLSNNICSNSAKGSRVCTNYSDSNFMGFILGLSGNKMTLQPFTTYKINLGSYKLSSAKTSMPLDVETTINYTVYGDPNFVHQLFNFSTNTDDSVYIP